MTNSFVIFPALGPVVPGHVLVVSRDHHPSFASLSDVQLYEYEELADNLFQKIPYANSQPLEGEHGATNTDTGGATVAHAHMHWFPTDAEIVKSLQSCMKQRSFTGPINFLRSAEPNPYVFLRRQDTYSCLFTNGNIPSQLLRRLVSEATGSNEWDWHSYPHWQWIHELVAKWRSI
ncbi:MAG: HIT domain-containing protein [Sedimentisphaerales bacterium]|nr:HIT domain-containing protein [Sedimentisphaerales bacterium]